MANGWLLNWARIATRERESLEAHCVENLFVVFVCVLSLIDAKRQFFYPQGAKPSGPTTLHPVHVTNKSEHPVSCNVSHSGSHKSARFFSFLLVMSYS